MNIYRHTFVRIKQIPLHRKFVEFTFLVWSHEKKFELS